jgi:cell division protein FtsA
MEEIIEQIYFEIRNSGYEKKLIGGIVLTGGGAQLKHIAQLTQFISGMDTRIGHPNEHLAQDVPDDMASPMYATGIGLVIEGIRRGEYERRKAELMEQELKIGKKKKKKPNGTGISMFGSRRFLDMLEDWFKSDTKE